MRNVQRNIKIMYLQNFLVSTIFYAPVFALFLQEQLFTVFNVTIILAINTILVALLEIPSGAFADLVGRRQTIIISRVISVVSLIIFSFSSSFWQIALATIVGAIGIALVSGTDEAIIFDSLKELKQEKKFKKVIGINHAIGPIGLSIASIIGGFIAKYSLRATIFYSLIPFGLALLTSFFLVEPKYHKSQKHMFKHIKESSNILIKNRQLLLIILLFFLFESFGESIHLISQLFYQYNQIPIEYFGFIFGAIFALSSLGSFISHKVSNFFGNKKTLIFSTIFSLSVFLLAIFSFGWTAVFFMVLGSIFYGIRNPIMSHMTNLEVKSKNRATILSIKNASTTIGFSIFAPILGLLVDKITIIPAFRIFSIGFVLLIIVQTMIKEKN